MVKQAQKGFSTKSPKVPVSQEVWDMVHQISLEDEMERMEPRHQELRVVVDGKVSIQIVQNDITAEEVDAVTNAANSGLMHGGGLAGAIVRKGGRSIQSESYKYVKKNGEVPTGSSCVTSAGDLKCKHVIHTVGPMYHSHSPDMAEQLLCSAILNTLLTAKSIGAKSVSIPAISSGIFGFPKKRCSEIIFETILKWALVGDTEQLEIIRICNFDVPTCQLFFERYMETFPQKNQE